MTISRRAFNKGIAGAAGFAAMGSFGSAQAARDNELNILCRQSKLV